MVKIKGYTLFVLVNIFMVGISSSLAGDVNLTQSTENNNSTITVQEINLTPTIKSFRKILARQLNKRDCEKKIFVKKAKLSTVKGLLVVDLQTRITRQYCTRRAKTQLYEKTSTVNYKYQVEIDGSGIALTEVGNNPGKASFLKSFKDVLEKDPAKRVAEILSNIINPQFDKINISMEQNKPIVTVVTNKILIEFMPLEDSKNTNSL